MGVVATDAFQSYGTDEVFDEHANEDVNHIVTLIGWDEDKHAWLIKNSWGTGWGTTGDYGSERGYMWIDYTSNKIGYGAVWSQAQQSTPVVTTRTTTWRIKEPLVTRSETIYDGIHTAPAIQFQAGDTVEITAGGCVQTGGSGRTWKRYVNPSGPNSDRLYFAKIQIPGVTPGLTPIRTAGCHYDNAHPDICTVQFAGSVPDGIPQTQLYLHLGYVDDHYGDNGYWGHDDGTQDQCKNVGNALRSH